ncbi:hypothetical protein FRC17_003552 [Serendipita sp. 399]|nr:hypothetical protein FRC17_003552 [Serendipita sp. 399]
MAVRPVEALRKLAIRPTYGYFVSGSYASGAGAPMRVHNPATGELLSTVTSTSNEQVNTAISLADEAFREGKWSQAPSLQRSIILSKLARSLEERIPDFAEMESLQTGRTIREMRAQLGRLPEWLDYYAALLRTQSGFVAPTQGQLLNYVDRIPLGVVVQITPFNHPMLIALKKIAPALAAGNSVVVKPSEQAPLTVLEFAALAHEAGIPPSVLTVVTGTGPELGKALVSNPLVKKVDITAGTATGRAIGSLAGSNLAAYTAELGGKAPVVIFEDADIQAAINGATFAAFIASGQTCVSATRLLVHEQIYDEFMSGLIDKVQKITSGIGNPLNPQSTMGPVISQASLERISAAVGRSTRRVLVGGYRMTGLSPLDDFDLSKGSFYAPTVIEDVGIDDEIWKEELFGPVVAVAKFKDEKHGVSLANASKYGLGAGIWTQNLSRAHRVAKQLEAGLVWVNTHHRNDPSSPWGGLKESGIGRENGIEAYESSPPAEGWSADGWIAVDSQSKSIIVNIASMDDAREKEDWFNEHGAGRRYG